MSKSDLVNTILINLVQYRPHFLVSVITSDTQSTIQ